MTKEAVESLIQIMNQHEYLKLIERGRSAEAYPLIKKNFPDVIKALNVYDNFAIVNALDSFSTVPEIAQYLIQDLAKRYPE